MSDYLWTSTSSQDPGLGANWTKSDGTTGTAPTTGDTATIAAVPGSTVASIWAAGGMGNPPTGLSSSGAASTGGHLAQSTNYFYKVTAIYATGESVPSAELSYSTPASGTATNTITVNWTAPATPGGTITGYKIYRSTTTNLELYLATVGVVLSYNDTSTTVPAGPMPGAATLAALTVSQTFSGSIGTAGLGGYWQVNTTLLNLGSPGSGIPGVGSSQLKFDLGSVASTVTSYNSGQSVTGYEPVLLKGSNITAINAVGGTIGVATLQPGETATVTTVNATGTQTTVNFGAGVTWTTANVAAGATVTTNSGGTAVSVASGSTAVLKGATIVTNVNNAGNVSHQVRPAAGSGSTTVNNYSGAVLDFTGNPANVTITTLNNYPSSTVRRNPANPGHLTITTRNLIECGNEAFS